MKGQEITEILLAKLMESGEGIPLGHKEIDKPKDVTRRYTVTGKEYVINKLEEIFDMLDKLSKSKKRVSANIELNTTLGGDNDYNTRISIKRTDKKIDLQDHEEGYGMTHKLNSYL